MRVSTNVLAADIQQVLVRHGIPQKDAAVGTEICLDAELRGRSSHGVRLVRNLVAEYQAGEGRRTPLAVVHQTPVSAAIDGGFNLSLAVHRTAVDLAAEKATASGIGIVSVRNAGVSGAVGYLVERIANHGLVGLSLNSSPAMVVAPGTTEPTLGTNPLAVAIPRTQRSPLVLDMATGAIAYNQVLRVRGAGDQLPIGVAVDGDGNPTTDPGSAIDQGTGRGRLLPFGGHRGYGLALMLEILVAAGVSGKAAAGKRGPRILEPSDFAAMYLAYDPVLVGDPASAASATEDLIADLQAQGARLPGESSRILRDERHRTGTIDIDSEAAEILAELLHSPL